MSVLNIYFDGACQYAPVNLLRPILVPDDVDPTTLWLSHGNASVPVRITHSHIVTVSKTGFPLIRGEFICADESSITIIDSNKEELTILRPDSYTMQRGLTTAIPLDIIAPRSAAIGGSLTPLVSYVPRTANSALVSTRPPVVTELAVDGFISYVTKTSYWSAFGILFINDGGLSQFNINAYIANTSAGFTGQINLIPQAIGESKVQSPLTRMALPRSATTPIFDYPTYVLGEKVLPQMRSGDSMTYVVDAMTVRDLKKMYSSRVDSPGLCNYSYTFIATIFIPALTVQIYDINQIGIPIVATTMVTSKGVGDEVEIAIGATSQLSASYVMSQTMLETKTKDTRYIIKATVITRLTEKATLVVIVDIPYGSTVTAAFPYKIVRDTLQLPIAVPARTAEPYTSYDIELAFVVRPPPEA